MVTTSAGGMYQYGTVFEIVKTAICYATAPTTLVSFNDKDGGVPSAGLIADSNGNLFGTTVTGGVVGFGTVFEVAGSGFVPPVKFAGVPGSPSCRGISVSTLANTYERVAHSAAHLGSEGVTALQSAVNTYCPQ
jgi:hypothetical protein